jgi:signal transduction histidine kinase
MEILRKFVILIAVGLILLYVFTPEPMIRLAFGLVFMVTFLYFFNEFETSDKKAKSFERELNRLTKICDELDENAKLIVKTDLQLSKTQEELDKKIHGLYVLHELGKKINAALGTEQLFELILETLTDQLGFEKALIFVKKGEKDACAQRALTESPEEKFDFPRLWECVHEEVVVNNKSLFASDILRETSPLTNKVAALLNAISFVIVPIALKDTTLGFLGIANSPPYSLLDNSDAEILATMASEIGVAIDNITLYEEIKKSHQLLEEKVKERTQELAPRNEELKKLNQMKSDFVSTVSHELRTPLTSIKGYATMLLENKFGEVTRTQKESLAKINKHSDYLTKLVSDLLDIARIESKRVDMVFKKVDFRDIITTIVEMVQPQLKEKDITLALRVPKEAVTIELDPDYMERVMINLLSNAIKFTPPDGTITITASANEKTLSVSVQDTGMGISKEDLSHLFEQFFRADNPINRKHKGTGLGLSLTKNIVESHGGTIDVKSELGHGSCFTFSMPRTQRAKKTASPLADL